GQARRPAADRDPLLQPVAREQPAYASAARGHPGDAVALRRSVADDLRDSVAGDRDPAERGRKGGTALHAAIRPDTEACGYGSGRLNAARLRAPSAPCRP